ncbi:MAG: type II toxin-antitoxin system VapC family toxin [Dactylosporangium sp.]|nr:type II toxin-antitoxin system VapC family toxin [Dactylosporangium sp.]
MAYLLDTNVVSELRKPRPHPAVAAWHARRTGAEAYLSSLVVGEIRQGIERIHPRDPQRAEALERWLTGLLSAYRSRILPVTVEIAHEWGRMNAEVRLPVVDGLMAATAKVHRLTLVTRNVADVARTGVPVVNPFEPE